MSRFVPNEDGDALDAGRWEKNLRASLEGKRGQRALRELREALLALPEPRLVRGLFTTAEGECCTLGALAAYRKARAEGVTITEAAKALHEAVDPEEGDFHTEEGVKAGMSRTMAWHLGYQNDDAWEWGKASPERRFEGVLGWVCNQIRGEADWTPREREIFARSHCYVQAHELHAGGQLQVYRVAVEPRYVEHYCERAKWEESAAGQMGVPLREDGHVTFLFHADYEDKHVGAKWRAGEYMSSWVLDDRLRSFIYHAGKHMTTVVGARPVQ